MGVLELVNRLRCFMAYWYFQWELNTALYMLEPAEKYIVNSVAIATIGVILFAALTYLPGHLIMMLHFMFGDEDVNACLFTFSPSNTHLCISKSSVTMPCFPHRKPKVVQPEETVQHKNVQRYGETNIRRANAPMPVDQWRKSRNSDPNQGRQLPQTPRENVVKEETYSRIPPQDPKKHTLQTEELLASTPKQPFGQQSRPSQPIKADFFVSVPIFTETLNHSFRKKNEYVYVDAPDDEGSVYHQSLSRGSSLRDLRPESARRPPTGATHYTTRQTSSVRKLRKRAPKEHRRRHYSGSEASFNTFSSRGTYGYESETFENPRLLQGQRTKSGLSVGSDDEDLR